MNILIGVVCFLIGGLVGITIMSCFAAAGFADEVERRTHDRTR